MAASDGRRGRPWRRLREQVLREEPWCYVCGDPATQVDHLMPLSQYPELAHVRSNLRAICRFHNISKHDALPGQWKPKAKPTRSVTTLRW